MYLRVIRNVIFRYVKVIRTIRLLAYDRLTRITTRITSAIKFNKG